MSEPDSNSAASLTTSPSVTTATETPTTVANTARPPPSQQPLVPPPSQQPPVPPPYTPIHHSNPSQQAYGYLFSPSIQNQHPTRQPNQDPTPVLYPYLPPGRGFSTRPVRFNSPFVAQPHPPPPPPPPPPPVLPYSNLAPNQMVSMIEQFLSARNPLIYHHQLPPVESVSSVRPRPKRGRHRKQVASPPATSVRGTSKRNNARSQDPAVALVRGRKVRITEGATLNSLCRSWLGNGVPVGGIQMQKRNPSTMGPLPKPLPAEAIKANVPNDPAEESTDEDKDDEDSVWDLSEKDLLKRHIERAKKVRARLRQERFRKIARYKERLTLIVKKAKEEDEEESKKND